jgi:hypothetical protein
MNILEIFNKIEYYRGHYKDHTKLYHHVVILYNNATEDMISLATNTKYTGIDYSEYATIEVTHNQPQIKINKRKK